MKIGVGVITCNRKSFLVNLLESLRQCNESISELIVINDGEALYDIELPFGKLINNETNEGVGKSKNKALKHLISADCDYIFLIEEDMLILDKDIFNEYIKASEETGIKHFMFGYHGPANKNNISGGKPHPRAVIQYPSGRNVAFNTHCVGSFCMYTLESLNRIGLIDEMYKNTWEHISHSYDLVKAGYAPGYWWWPDLKDSPKYITEQACSEQSSSIRGTADWHFNMVNGAQHFKSKHGYFPTEVPSISTKELTEVLKKLVK